MKWIKRMKKKKKGILSVMESIRKNQEAQKLLREDCKKRPTVNGSRRLLRPEALQ